MSVAVVRPVTTLPSRPRRKPQAKSPRDLQRLLVQLSDAQATYSTSAFAHNIEKQLLGLTKSSTIPITRIVSLGLGSLSNTEKGQTRRIKQLAILLTIRESLQKHMKAGVVEVYAQDPTFTRQDEALLSSFDIRILRTASGASLGEAADVIDESTLVYSPFLTLEAYEQLLVGSRQLVQYLIGDDFNALLEKWPKYSAERMQVQKVTKAALGRYRRKAISGSGFWEEADGAYPMAVYAAQKKVKEKARI
ncbi:uncharacterized protein N0V89_000470 [Didymosphaeria variabile]|uniref:SRR1-like domain-containing protein n=1 Tax=Didymosphaeria variabile TaxID=1932322 RepID=A0A9W9CEZ1_9PLEO|nr:uncharacterized protein N0V89_000470 [Didymosphaeria variabile]KAJ4359913.1 hypothetical protein N0V89_000470 [Didymosphaeria variabile]